MKLATGSLLTGPEGCCLLITAQNSALLSTSSLSTDHAIPL